MTKYLEIEYLKIKIVAADSIMLILFNPIFLSIFKFHSVLNMFKMHFIKYILINYIKIPVKFLIQIM